MIEEVVHEAVVSVSALGQVVVLPWAPVLEANEQGAVHDSQLELPREAVVHVVGVE